MFCAFVPLYSESEFVIIDDWGSWSGFTKVSSIGLKSKIPTPALLGVVLKVPIKASLLLRLI